MHGNAAVSLLRNCQFFSKFEYKKANLEGTRHVVSLQAEMRE
ncbi:hypothetical protein MC7420_1752 [Coleofasciculus chthonoplastes PCC 7420]|uniref:Uncharacterized protein n=1 Tax=Coleofasciculus chthonoplastes PCC 7420 TaxID=118168 RepID=B4VM97_9CYAN|nr:hypothetical protein MC7420_1752 [Coleofasciculus chthonoplastes PCC 7420]